MTDEELKELFDGIAVWRRGDERAPHKPLLLLLALGRCARGLPRELPFREADPELTRLLREFGPRRSSCHPEYPFWRLQADDLWELTNAEKVASRASNTDAKKSELLRFDVRGAFPAEVHDLLSTRQELAVEVARELLDAHFPDSYHEELAAAVGLDLSGRATKARRDPAFRGKVLAAYEYRCAVCGFEARLGDTLVGVDAAHIRWHQAGGPDEEPNGLALCALHHRLFDRGAFTVWDDMRVVLAQSLHGHGGFEAHLLTYHGASVQGVANPAHRPEPAFLRWHQREVFRGPARFLEGASRVAQKGT